MRLNKKGFGLQQMLILSAVLIIFLLFIAYYIFVLYSGLDESIASQYALMETRIQKAAIEYANNYEHSNIVTLKELQEVEYLDFFTDSNDDSCDGYVVIGDREYKPYIKCQNYTTKGYNK